MQIFFVTYTDAADCEWVYKCHADDEAHAREQAEDSEEGATATGVYTEQEWVDAGGSLED